MIELLPHERGIVIQVKAQPQARKNAIVGEHAGMVRVAVTAAPEKGKANDAILEVLADALGCRASALTLLSGETHREKKVLAEGWSAEAVREKLEHVMA